MKKMKRKVSNKQTDKLEIQTDTTMPFCWLASVALDTARGQQIKSLYEIL